MLRILGIRVDEYDMEQSLDNIEALLDSAPEQTRQVVTINPEGVWLARTNEEFRQIIEQAFLVTPDGTGILWAAQQQGRKLKERVTGIELLEQICRRAAQQGWHIYLLGAKPGFAEEAAAVLQQRYAGLNIVGTDNGYFRDREESAIAAVRQSQPDVLFAALGMPFQEQWVYQHRHELGAKLAVGVGGSFDVISGHVRRAPQLWQKLRIEWLWRLFSDPKRWRRYLVIPRFMAAVRKEARQQKNK